MQKRGKNVMIFIDNEAVALSTRHTLTVNPQLDETRTKDDAVGPVAEFDYADWEVGIESLVGANENVTSEQTFVELIDTMLDGDSVMALLDQVDESELDDAVPAAGWSKENDQSSFPSLIGSAYISELTIDAGETGIASMSCRLMAAGTLHTPA